ncbi:hypothetical protein CIB48_g9773 [Xylaria polymorpha]|nr:hypothetical protein CIB48_g9773 [Xylaria polymorpha]
MVLTQKAPFNPTLTQLNATLDDTQDTQQRDFWFLTIDSTALASAMTRVAEDSERDHLTFSPEDQGYDGIAEPSLSSSSALPLSEALRMPLKSVMVKKSKTRTRPTIGSPGTREPTPAPARVSLAIIITGSSCGQAFIVDGAQYSFGSCGGVEPGVLLDASGNPIGGCSRTDNGKKINCHDGLHDIVKHGVGRQGMGFSLIPLPSPFYSRYDQ